MNIFQLVLKQMRQRALSTWLTLLSVMLGVALAVVIMLIRRESAVLFGQTDYGFDIIVGAKASSLQLVMNTVYHIDRSPGNIPYSVYKQLTESPQFRPAVRMAVPTAVGDSYQGQRIVGTIPQLFGMEDDGITPIPANRTMQYRPGKRYEIAQGRVFHGQKFEAVIGADITKLTGLKLGDIFKATHGLPKPGETPDIHGEEWTVVGVLKETGTAADRVLYISLPSFYAMSGHDYAMKAQAAIRQGIDTSRANAPGPTTAYDVRPDGTIELHLPESDWALSAVLVKSRSPFFASQMMYVMNNGQQAAAVNPASVMREFFNTFLQPTTRAWGAVAYLVNAVAIVAILVSIYNSVAARIREIAILRALGATRRRVMLTICLEAGLIGLAGGVLGIAAGHLLGALVSGYFQQTIGEGIRWWIVSREEWLYLLSVTVVSMLAGLVPAMKAYRTPVADNLAGV
ncbi:MAG TPA: ABC transporter permease [Tepidisphaeraceae bacterium]|nr:ABC transporter permease [Tepidisphaeraceae bacterium]